MTKKERVAAAIAHKPVDRVPKGELAIESGIRDVLLADYDLKSMSHLGKEKAVRELLSMDLVNIHEFPVSLSRYDSDGFPIYRSAFGDLFKDNGISTHIVKSALDDISDEGDYAVPDIALCTTHTLDYYRENSDFYLMAQINGPVSAVDWMLGMEDYLCYCITDPEAVQRLARKVMTFEVARAKIFLDHGADAIMMTDDIAFNSGLLMPPAAMDLVAYPIYKEAIAEIKAYKNVPVFMHTDGYMYDALDHIVNAGFDGLHSLQPSAGMDIEKVLAEYGDKLCLMGNLDLDHLLTFDSPQAVTKEVKRLLSLTDNKGGFILSTCNILTNSVKPENALAMYHGAENSQSI